MQQLKPTQLVNKAINRNSKESVNKLKTAYNIFKKEGRHGDAQAVLNLINKKQ